MIAPSGLMESAFATRGSNTMPLEGGWGHKVEGGGDEIRRFEDLEVALGGVVAFGAVDDGFDGGVPGDFLEGVA